MRRPGSWDLLGVSATLPAVRRAALLQLFFLTVCAGAACKQLAGLNGELSAAGGGGASGSGSTAAQGSVSGSSVTTSSTTSTETAASTATAASDATSTGSAPMCNLANRCLEAFDDGTFDGCLTDNDTAETYADIIGTPAGTLTLSPAPETGFWSPSSNGARFIYANVGAGQPFAAVTRVRAFAPGTPGVLPGLDTSLAGLALRRANDPIDMAEGWFKNEAGRLEPGPGIRVAYGPIGGGSPLADVIENDASNVVTDATISLEGVSLGICRYDDNTVHTFYQLTASGEWREALIPQGPHSAPGSVDVGIVTASFSNMAPQMHGEFSGVILDECTQLNAATCPVQLEQLASMIPTF